MTNLLTVAAMAISLAGQWDFALDGKAVCDDVIMLPGTTDIARKGAGKVGGEPVERLHPQLLGADMTKELTLRPTRRFPFVGVATYERDIEIPPAWAGRRIELMLERTKIVTVFLDGAKIGSSDTLATPAVVVFPADVKPGRHRLRLEVDNRLDNLPVSGHQVAEDTQTNWNGILGRIELRAVNPCRVTGLAVFPDAEKRRVRIRMVVANDSGEAQSGKVVFSLASPATAESVREFAVSCATGVSTNFFSLECGPNAPLWSEFNPVMHTLKCLFSGEERIVKFGLRNFRVENGQFTINGKPLFLRGRHDACVWPITGATPMDLESWRRYFKIARDYGLNHVRFHSWCPPEAAFVAADELGIYLQPEFACFGGDFDKSEALRKYCLAESKRILDAFGNHPSFVMFALANEPVTGRGERAKIIAALRAYDPRPLYAQGSNFDYNAQKQAVGDDYWCTFRSTAGAEGNTRGSYANADLPHGAAQLPGGGTMRDYSASLRYSSVPLIGHETGQYQIYPDYGEIAKYEGGVFKPLNLEVFRNRLKEAGMLPLAEDFHRASGALAVINYREEIEEALRTPKFGGFQLLDLQDYPGQGTALVGILNAFLESKGLISPEKWREFCSPVVLLARFPKYTYSAGEKFSARIQIAHYGEEDVLGGRLKWRLANAGGKTVESGVLVPSVKVGTVGDVGEISFELPKIFQAETVRLELSLEGRGERNEYPLWIYPVAAPRTSKVKTVRDIGAAEKLLESGENVLCILDRNLAPKGSVEGFFTSDFWNWRMFKHVCEVLNRPVAPGTLGLLIDCKHPALAKFPTSYHSDYQWRELIFNGVNVVLDGDEDARIIVQGIDNFVRNHRLGVIWEKRRGNAKMVVCAIDLERAGSLPEARALKDSLLEYVAGK